MRQIPLRDVVLLLALGPLWLFCVGLHTAKAVRGDLVWVPVYVQAAPETGGAPLVRGFMPGSDASALADLAPGDRILRAGDRDLAGAGPIDFALAAWEPAATSTSVPLLVERDGARREVELPYQRVLHPARLLIVTLAFGSISLLTLLAGRGSRSARALALAGVAYSLQWALFQGGPRWQTALSLAVTIGTAALFAPLTLRAMVLLPQSVVPPSRLGLAWPWLFALLVPATSSWILGVPFDGAVGLRMIYGLNVAFIAALLLLVVHGFLRADGLGRRQLKWVVLGFTLGLLPVIATSAVGAVEPRLTWLYELSLAATVAIPACLYVAILRYRFGDIDRLLSATTTWSILSIGLLAALLTLVPAAGRAISELSETGAAATQVALSLALATLIVPSQRFLGPRIERVVFRERFRLERGLRALRGELAACGDPSSLFKLLGERFDELLWPDNCIIYGRTGDDFSAVFARAPSVAPAFDASGSLAALLADRGGPADRARWRRWARSGLLSERDRASIESADPDLLLPVMRESELAAFICLGTKRSGDIFTSAEQAWLAAAADRVSEQLRRFDDAEILRETRALQRALRSYVPGAIAEELDEGRDLAPREREVSVLFVDIRGYTSYAEGRRPEEIFSTVNRYTEIVSSVVRKYEGSVVEFNGDGMMVVFGAPRDLANKERAAVDAAREIVGTVPELPIRGKDGEPLSVGVGVATGPAFVGNIRAVDRSIWSAIGNTTNLAARLQSLTRDLDAAIAIDPLTHTRAGPSVDDFEARREIRVRGRSDPQDIHVLPR